MRLNGVELVTSRDLTSQPRGSVELPVTLAASNTREVRQTGRPGSQLELRIVDTRAAAAVRITPLMALLVEVAATRAYTAEVLDAEGRPLARCITWSTTDPAVAAVGMDGIVRGVGVGAPNWSPGWTASRRACRSPWSSAPARRRRPAISATAR